MKYFDLMTTEDGATNQNNAILAEDPNIYLPTRFTVCSSIFIGYFDNPAFFQLWTDGGEPWIWLSFYVQDLISKTYSVGFFYGHNMEIIVSIPRKIPVKPQAWSNGCVGLDLEAKTLRIVVNGIFVHEGTLNIERNITKEKPTNLKDRMLIGSYQMKNKMYSSKIRY